jgi:hypothetical protein
MADFEMLIVSQSNQKGDRFPTMDESSTILLPYFKTVKNELTMTLANTKCSMIPTGEILCVFFFKGYVVDLQSFHHSERSMPEPHATTVATKKATS